MKTELHILKLAHAYADFKNLKLSTISTYSSNHGSFLSNLEKGSSLTVHRARKIIDWFSENWPADLAWPNDIERPNNNSAAKVTIEPQANCPLPTVTQAGDFFERKDNARTH